MNHETSRNLSITRAALAAGLLLLAAAALTQANSTQGGLLSVKVGASGLSQNIKVEFVSVLSDSRCPTGKNCGKGGSAEVKLRLWNMPEVAKGDAEPLPPTAEEANMSSEGPSSKVRIAGATVHFVKLDPVSPAKTGNLSPNPADRYTLTVRVEPAVAAPPSTLSLALGGTANYAGVDITFVGITSDNRCPLGTTCVVAGNAAVELSVQETKANPAVKKLKLNSDLPPTTAKAYGLSFRFKSLEPHPVAPTNKPGPQLLRAIPVLKLAVRSLAP